MSVDNECSVLFFGLQLCFIDEIAVLTEIWRRVRDELQKNETIKLKKATLDIASPSGDGIRTNCSKNAFPEQGSVPLNTILPVYAHSKWIPFVSDRAGN